MEVKKSILMFSGGLDSFIIKSLLKIPDEDCIFVNLGTKENLIEEENIKQNFKNVRRLNFPLIQFELNNYIIPFRNHFLALIGGQFGNCINFGFTIGDTTKDKDYVFKSQMEGILNYFSLDPDKVRIPGPFEIQLPFKNLTKSELVSRYIIGGFSVTDLITKSVSCYEGGLIPCGQCRSCLRRYIAFTLNGIDCSSLFQMEISLHQLEEFQQESIRKNRLHELNDIKKCIKQKQQ